MNKKNASYLLTLVTLMLAMAGCRETLPKNFAGSGVLEAKTVNVSSLSTGVILELVKEEGDRVQPGERLCAIDVEKLRYQKAQVEASLKEIDAGRLSADAAISQASDNFLNVESKYKRIKQLYVKGSATQQQFDDIETQFNVAKNQLVAAKAQLPLLEAKQAQADAMVGLLSSQIKDGTLLSPLSGVIVEKYMEAGEVAVQGTPLFKIADLSTFWIKIHVAGPDMGRFALGERVSVKVDAHETLLSGTVTWSSEEAAFTPKNVQTREARAELVYPVKITLKEAPSHLKIGMPGEVYFVE
jgi:HlyD family secretion protein